MPTCLNMHHARQNSKEREQPGEPPWLTCSYDTQVQDLEQAAGEADLQELYMSAPQLLRGYSDKPDAACALLQVSYCHVQSQTGTADLGGP